MHSTTEQPGVKRGRTPFTETDTRSKSLLELPEAYTIVPPVEPGFNPPEFPAAPGNKVKGNGEAVPLSIRPHGQRIIHKRKNKTQERTYQRYCLFL